MLLANVENDRRCEGLGNHWQTALLATSVHFMVIPRLGQLNPFDKTSPVILPCLK